MRLFRPTSLGALSALLLVLPGCLKVHETEHLIRLTSAGAGDAILRLRDIRSDGVNDSAVAADVSHLVDAANGRGIALFEQNTRKLVSRQFSVTGDSVNLEIRYTFTSLVGVEGLRANTSNLFLVVGPENEIVRTNGKVEAWLDNTQRILWSRDATRLSYTIREHFLRKTSSILRWYREQTR
jgi:hypothetical protein